MEKDVYVYKMKEAKYPHFPYNPSEHYPEFQQFIFSQDLSGSNEVYNAVRQLFYKLGFDAENYGKDSWNPLKNHVLPGQSVLIKPNLVFHEHPFGEDEVLSMISNASVLRPVIDYVLLATGGDVNLVIGDAPVQGGDFQEAVRISGIDQLVKFYESNHVKIQLIDMRMLISKRNKMGVLAEKKMNPSRSPEMYVCVDLKQKSELYPVIKKAKRFEITDYGKKAVLRHHNQLKNEYLIPKEVLEVDLFINIPKLKTHRKAGLTCAMKNLVGINGDKTCLAHHTRGLKNHGGDEFSEKDFKTIFRTRLWAFLKRHTWGIKIAGLIKCFFQRVVWNGQSLNEYKMLQKPKVFAEGSWYGNDTIWRCVKDLNKIILYADRNGKMQDIKQRKYLCIVDAILAGEKEGPMEQSTKEFGVIFGGVNPVYIDYTAAKLMRYDYRDVPVIANSFKNQWWNLVEKKAEDVVIDSNNPIDNIASYFIPSFGWQDKLYNTQSTERLMENDS